MFYHCNLDLKLNYIQRLSFLNINSLQSRRRHAELIMVYKLMNNLVYVDYGNILETYLNNSTTKIHSDVNRINSFLKFFSNRVSSFRNSLPRSTTSAPSLKSFIERVSSWNILFQQLFGIGLLCLYYDIPSLDIRRCHYLNIGFCTSMGLRHHICFFYNLSPSIMFWVCLTSILIFSSFMSCLRYE